MSSFQVTFETIHAVVDLLLPPKGRPTDDERTSLGRDLIRLNQRSLLSRYGEPVNESMIGMYAYRFRSARVPAWCVLDIDWEMTRVRSATCWRYQCSEECAVKSDLYQRVDAAISRASQALLRRIPGYDKIPWELPESA